MMANLLIIARDEEAPAGLGDSLASIGMDCSITSYANGVREAITQRLPDVILFELTERQPDEEIRGLFKRLKGERSLPVIALVSPEMLGNIDGDTEFDDFLSSPVNPAELAVRITRLLGKRRKSASDETIECDGLQIDLATCEVAVDDRLVELTFKEYELLKLLASNRGRVFTRDALLDKIWGYDYFGGDRTVDVHIRRLRSKIEEFGHTFIETVRNIGYRFRK
jgi:two-component system alkaline phosphatase synthesis response regulator PhoP